MPYFTDILYSQKIDKYYIGYSENLQNRLDKHNSKHKGFTGQVSDWIIVYSEKYELKEDAINREKEIKAKKSRKYIEYLISKDK